MPKTTGKPQSDVSADEQNATNVAIRFKAQVARVQTMVDGGIRVTLDLSENDIDVARELMRARKDHFILEVAAVAVVSGEEDVDTSSLLENATEDDG